MTADHLLGRYVAIPFRNNGYRPPDKYGHDAVIGKVVAAGRGYIELTQTMQVSIFGSGRLLDQLLDPGCRETTNIHTDDGLHLSPPFLLVLTPEQWAAVPGNPYAHAQVLEPQPEE